ncbi:gamma-aminobutyric acid type B receptor subunit 1-like [Diaphorina citri]|uniref:Gamma-aminobutyric acid type B receptor subunit 1-like n=1 Tax=Diaphorina citri TaxID=121845 RepID=A0A3Q0JH33_DIACI|nr:gamma-aminobutyric acid type B receptor subunit 1-like [Diaphorina citri]
MGRLKKQGKTLKSFTYTNKEIADDIYAAINSTQFTGVSGDVAFSSQGDRIALTQIEQVINGSYTKLGFYDTQADNLTWFDRERWIGGKVPQDRTQIRKVLRTISVPLVICMWTVATVGILFAVGLIIFNICYRHRRVIASSHPVCNTIMLVGIAFCMSLNFNLPFCEPGLGASVMYNLLYNNPQKLMLLAGCSTVCTTVAEAAKMWNLVVTEYFVSVRLSSVEVKADFGSGLLVVQAQVKILSHNIFA